MRRATPLALAVLVISFVCVSLFSRHIPTATQNVLFLVVLLLELVMIVAGWWFLLRTTKSDGIAVWRKRMALVAVIANTSAFAVPVMSLFYMMFYPWLGLRIGLPMVDAEVMMLACLGLSLVGLTAAIVAPGRSRIASALGCIIIALLVLAIPMGVL